jgi:hypothetical protein
MTQSRRKFLKIIGGGTIVAAAGMGGFVTTRTPTKALAPWDLAGSYEDPRMQALSYALLAPNPHNRQPWEVDLSRPDKAIIWRDKARDLPHTDPFARQLTIGMGCFLELMTIAASHNGHKVDLELFPDGEDGPVAIATFLDGASPDPLFAHVLERRTCREQYEDRDIPSELAAKLSQFANIITEREQVSPVRDLTRQAWVVEANTPKTWKESVDLTRIGKSEINGNPDGISLGGPFFESLALVGVLTREANLDTGSTSFKQGLAIIDKILTATPAYAVITTAGNSRRDQIEAGYRWLRLNLMTTSLGLSLQPVSQALQEYPEMAEHYETAHALLAEPGETVQMLGRLGYGPKIPRSPRWPLETRLING